MLYCQCFYMFIYEIYSFVLIADIYNYCLGSIAILYCLHKKRVIVVLQIHKFFCCFLGLDYLKMLCQYRNIPARQARETNNERREKMAKNKAYNDEFFHKPVSRVLSYMVLLLLAVASLLVLMNM